MENKQQVESQRRASEAAAKAQAEARSKAKESETTAQREAQQRGEEKNKQAQAEAAKKAHGKTEFHPKHEQILGEPGGTNAVKKAQMKKGGGKPSPTDDPPVTPPTSP